MKRLFVFLILLVFAAMPVFAQEIGTSVRLGSGYGITVPAGWEIRETSDYFEIFRFAQTIRVLMPVQLGRLITLEADADANDILLLYAEHESLIFEGISEIFEIDGRFAAAGVFASGANRVIVVQMSDGSFGVVEINGGVFNTVIDPLLLSFDGEFDIEESADLNAVVVTPTATRVPITPAPETTRPASRQACIASVDAPDQARLRMGPLPTRGALGFLAPDTRVPVMESYINIQGVLWYRLSAQAALPGTTALEVWVAADDVNTTGDCDTVLRENTAPDDADSAAVSPIYTPVNGFWNIIYEDEGVVSCQSNDDLTVSPSRVGLVNGSVLFAVSASGASFSDGEIMYLRVEGTNSFVGILALDNGRELQAFIEITSPETMDGIFVWRQILNGVPCRVTFGTTFEAN